MGLLEKRGAEERLKPSDSFCSQEHPTGTGLGLQAEELHKKASVLTNYQPNFAIRVFVPTGHHGANCVVYHRDHVQVEFLRRDGIAWVFLKDTACYICSCNWKRTCLLSMGLLLAPTDFLQPHTSAGRCSNLKTQLQRSWHAGMALPETAPRAGALGGLHWGDGHGVLLTHRETSLLQPWPEASS